MHSVRWNIAVSPDTDRSVRMFIAAHGTPSRA
ncbi:ribbon-helix-helix domain-containing protein [Methylolobus aquaticus]